MVKGNQRGSAVIAAVVVALVVISLLGAGLTISLYYQNASLENHAKRQAYLNAKAVCESMAIEMQSSNANKYLPSSTSDTVNLNDIKIGDSSGTITGTIKYTSNSSITLDSKTLIKITITAVYNKQTETVSLTMKYQNSNWYKGKFSSSKD